MMNTLVFYIVCIVTSIFIGAKADEAKCSGMQCSPEGPRVQFPFRLESQEAGKCVYNGFEAFCKENKTMIHIPSYGDLIVKSITYSPRRLDLLDLKNCVHGVFLNLNLSSTPFRYYYSLRKYTYMNCTVPISSPFHVASIPCLSGSNHYVYTMKSSRDMPASCKLIKTVAIPFEYSPYISDNSFGLGLTWDQPAKIGVLKEHIIITVVSLGAMIIFVVATLVSVKVHQSKKLDKLKRQHMLGTETFLGDNKYEPSNIGDA